MRAFTGFVVACVVAGAAAAAPPSYDRDVAPILRTYCAGCHNDRDREGELSVERFASLRAGGAESGDPVVPRDPAVSVMLQRIESDQGDHMPPADEPQPTAADLQTLRDWVAAGAPGPREDVSILQTLVVPPLTAYAGTKPVTAVAVVKGGRVAVAHGKSVGLFAPAVAGEPQPLGGGPLSGRVNALHATADGRSLVLALGITGLRGVAEIRDIETGRLVRSFGDHRDALYDAELSPDEKTLATAGYDRSVKLWNVADGTLLRSIDVHDGAVFDLAWHPGGTLLASASADETVKLWRVADGVRLDTLNQPQGELVAVAFTPDGRHVVAAGRDRRIHLWALRTLDAPGLNPPLHSRFAHESPIVALAISTDGRHLLSAAEDRSLKCWSLPDLVLERDHPLQSDLVSAVVPRGDGFLVGRMDGSLEAISVAMAQPVAMASAAPVAAGAVPAVSGSTAAVVEAEPNDAPAQAAVVTVPAVVKGTIGRPGDTDCFRFHGRAGQTIVVETDAARSKSRLDSRVEVLDTEGRPIEQVVLQSTRDSWFTFRGKDSNQTGDFRVHNWMEMQLDQYLYANGEVVKLWLHPRGADSGFDVYPGEGGRHAYFGTTSVTHALGEPAWIVEPLPAGSTPVPNGLPVFRLYYENDDESTRRLGADSHVLFPVPRDGEYVVRVSDVRGFGATDKPDDFRYALSIRPAKPGFTVTVGGKDAKVSPGSGREIVFTATRFEGFDGPIRIEAAGLPAGFTFHGPIEIETGQRKAIAVLTAAADAVAPDAAADKAVAVRAIATVAGVEVVQELGTLGDLQLGPKPKVTVEITPAADTSFVQQHPGEPLEFTIRPGQTITAKVKATRHDFKDRIDFGKADSGRNLPHGVYVDNIGLNGLLVVEGQDEREFFLSAAPVVRPGHRLFHLRASPDGGQASVPVVLNVLPGAAPAPRDDRAWLREKGTLLFADSFDREEDGNLAQAIGNGWTSATADRVPGVKQADLDGGVLKITVDPKAGHGAHIHHDAGFEDGGATLRFRLPGLTKGESLTVGFVDREMPGVHAGHLAYAFIYASASPPHILLRDHKTGVSDQEIRKRRDPFLKAKQTLPEDLEVLLASKAKECPWQADNEWHELTLVTEGDEMRVSVDGEPIGSHRSAGFAHPVKRWFSLGIPSTAWIDDVKVWKVR